MSRQSRTKPAQSVATQQSDYSRVIDVILTGTHDATAMVGLLAKEHPAIFMDLHNRTVKLPVRPAALSPSPDWVRTVAASIAGGNKVAAIKELRTVTGYGLKEAKDVVDRAHLRTTSYQSAMSSSEEGHITLTSSQDAVVAQLVAELRRVS